MPESEYIYKTSFSQVEVWRINFIHRTYLSHRVLFVGCLLNYRLEDMKEDGNVCSFRCYRFYLHWFSSSPYSNRCGFGFLTALCFGPLGILECQRSKDSRTVPLKL